MKKDKREGLAQKVASGELTRDQLDAMARRGKKTETTTVQRVQCAIPKGTVTEPHRPDRPARWPGTPLPQAAIAEAGYFHGHAGIAGSVPRERR
jgi:hypothetical protein